MNRLVTRWKIYNYLFISLKMHGKTYSNHSVNVLKKAVVENGTKFPKTYGNTYAIVYDSTL